MLSVFVPPLLIGRLVADLVPLRALLISSSLLFGTTDNAALSRSTP